VRNKKKTSWKKCLLADTRDMLQRIGRLVSEARKRRKISISELACRAGVDRRTLTELEHGNPAVSIGIFFQVLSILNLLKGMDQLFLPENDIEVAISNVRKIRKDARELKSISKEKVDF